MSAKEIAKLGQSCRSLRFWLQRRCDEAEVFLENCKEENGGPKPVYIDQLRKQIRLVVDAHDKCEQQLHKLSFLLVDKEDETEKIEAKLSEISKEATATVAELHKGLAACEEQKAAEVQRAHEQATFMDAMSDGDTSGGGSRIRAVSALQPRLEGNNPSPAEVTVFIDKFRAYYVASNFNKASPVEQRGYFFNCIPDNMYRAVKEKCDADTPAISEDATAKTCATILREEVLREHPIQERRATLFNARQTAAQTFSEFITGLEQLAEEAEVNTMLADDVMCMLYITGVNDDKLREKFLEVDQPTKKKLQLVAVRYYASRISFNAVKDTRQTAPQASSFNVGNNSNNRPTAQGGAKPKTTAKTPDPVRAAVREGVQRLIKQGFCPKCGEKAPKDHKCPAADHVCNECSKKGHIERVCQRAAAKAAGKASANNVDNTENADY